MRVRRLRRQIRQQHHSTRAQVRVVLGQHVLVERREVTQYPQLSAGRTADFQDGVSPIRAACVHVEGAVSSCKVDSGRIRRRPAPSLPYTPAAAEAGPGAAITWKDVKGIKHDVEWMSSKAATGQVIYIPQNSLYAI